VEDKLEFRLLGPVEVHAGGVRLPLGGPKQRTLLALLVLRAGEPVARDVLIDALWDERPTATAATALHGYVSQLRKVLEPRRGTGAPASQLVTREPGYALVADADQIDAVRFRQLAAAGRARLAEGAPDVAAGLLRQALDLWRGPALADVATAPALVAEAARLEEERTAALEDRIESDLALGRHAEVVGELEALIAADPLSERPRAQIILALYRCGRQADALAAYRDARRTLVDEVGIEPGPELRELEQRVLAQDPALELAPGAVPSGRGTVAEPPIPEPVRRAQRSPRRRWLRPALACAAVVAVTAAVLAIRGGGDSSVRAVPVSGNSVAAIDPATNAVVASVPVGGTPTAIASGEGALWVLNADDQTVSRVDPATQAVKTFGTGGVPLDIAVGEGALWVGNGRRGHAQFVGPSTASVASFDVRTNGLRASVALPRRRHGLLNTNTDHLAVGAGAVWAVGPDYSVSRIDPGSTEIVGEVSHAAVEAVASGPEGVWGRTADSTLVRLDRLGPRIRIAASELGGMAVGEGAVWAAAPHEGKLWRVDSEAQLVARPIDVGEGASAVTVGEGAVWVANALDGTVARVDPETNRVVETIDVGGTPRRLAIADGRVWVTVAGSPRDQAPVSSVGGEAGLPEGACGRVFYGGGERPDGLIVSDMPLRGGPQLPTQQMSDAIAYVLRARGFRAGRYRIAYQSCDDSTEQSGIFDPNKCEANAKVFAATTKVLGEVGPFNSACAAGQIPIAGAAPDGPLGIIGPTTTAVGLTRPSADASGSDVARLYPGGRRNFVRLLPDEAAQGAAAALEAKRLGAQRVVVLSDGGYGGQPAASFARAARSIGLRVLALREWRPHAAYRALGRSVASASPDVVYVAGLLDSGGARVIRDVRAALGPDVPLIANDGLLPVSKLFRGAGLAARGVRITFPGLTLEGLPPAGRHFVAQFGATQPGVRVDEAAVYAAAAMTLMLDAVARSDGTRPSVTAELLRARASSGLLGDVRFDARGDPTRAPITILRAEHGGGDDRVTSHEGAAVERVLYPRSGLGG
jgi:YVTN family beta-propeller protein